MVALFSPQHGFWSELQDNMVESADERDPDFNLPIYSLYSTTRQPLPEMLDQLDTLVIDLQDVGTRVYTFIWTVTYCLEACAQRQLPVVVLDRPNPLGGCVVEGPILHRDFTSFVGRAPIPMRHALTMGELTGVTNHLLQLGADVSVIPLSGWDRAMLWPETGRSWVAPSPNLPRWEGAILYPGQVLLEGTTLSEGRGTTLPFELCGAPDLPARDLIAAMRPADGLVPRPIRFQPTFQKHAGKRCEGIQFHIEAPTHVRSYATVVDLLHQIGRLRPTPPIWRQPPYEYETEKMPIDILSGNRDLRETLDRSRQERSLRDDVMTRLTAPDLPTWREIVTPYLLYGDPDDLN